MRIGFILLPVMFFMYLCGHDAHATTDPETQESLRKLEDYLGDIESDIYNLKESLRSPSYQPLIAGTAPMPTSNQVVSNNPAVASTTDENSASASFNDPSTQGAAQIWRQNCMYCHQLRSSTSYTPAQWDVALFHHMIYGYILFADYEPILQLLKGQ